MIRPSKKTLFAIESVLDIAYHSGGEPVQSSEITRRQGIPRRYLEQALQQLVRGGILVGVRGPKGGYRLARERRRISIGDIVRCIGALEDEEQAQEAPTSASELGQKVVQPLWAELREEFMARLDGVTIDDLFMRSHAMGLLSEAQRRMDFTI